MADNKKGLIGFFDSGFGGLDILRGTVKKLPNYHYVYFGDTARAPYGNRSKEEIYCLTEQAVDFLFKKGCELIVVACNTASSDALRKIQQEYLPKNYPSRRVLGVLIPAAEVAGKLTKSQRVGVIATAATVKSKAFNRELKKVNKRLSVFQNACPLLVPLVEYGEEKSPATKPLLENYLRPIIKSKIDTLILGCTHYGLLKKQLQGVVGKRVMIVSGAEAVPIKLVDYLKRHPEIESRLIKKSKVEFYSTDQTNRFAILGSRFFGRSLKFKRVDLANLNNC